jgi:hypothetical protein
MVNQYGDDGLQLLIVVGATDEHFNNTPTPEYCQALQATQDGHVLCDPNEAMTATLNMRINTGSALLDQNGIWLTNPVGEETFGEAFGALFSLFRTGPGFK